MSKKNKGGIFLLYLFFGVYLINIAFEFVEIPEIVSNLDNFIIGIAGILILVGGINYLRLPVKVH